VDGTIDPTATGEATVGCVDDGIDGHRRDVVAYD
jgi:hypothetical protein